MIWLFGTSILFLAWVKIKKNITLLGPFGFFFAYQVIYNFTPWLAFSLGVDLFSLSQEQDLLACQLLLASTCNFAFGIIYLLFWKPTIAPKYSRSLRGINPQLIFWVAFFPTLFMVQHYGWNSFTSIMHGGGQPTILNSITSYMKLFLVASFIHCLCWYKFAKSNRIILFALIFLLFVDGARSNFMMVIAISLFFIHDGGQLKVTWRTITGAVTVLAILVFSRSLRLQNNFYQNILDTFLAEGITGSYMNIQTIYLLKNMPSFPFTYGLNYILDPIVSLTPLARFTLGSLETWIIKVSSYLSEPYAPVGGFYYMAESLTSFGWVGPPLITTIFATITIWLNNRIHKNQSIYLIFLSTFGCLFAKTQFINCFKLFTVTYISFYVVKKITTLPLQKAKNFEVSS